MSSGYDIESQDPGISIDDEGEYVDRRIKKRILDARDRVDQREDSLWTGSVMDPELDVDEAQLLVAWGNTVKQYLRNIEVLLDRLPIDSSDFYLSQVDLGSVTIAPPDQAGFEFSRLAGVSGDDDVDEGALRQQLGLPRGVDIPWPQTRHFNGLQSLIESDSIIHEQWVVCVDNSGPPPTHQYLQLQQAQPIPKWIYEAAIRAADRFLHDAGIGVEIKAEPWRSTEPGL